MFLLTQSKNYQGNLFSHYFKNKYKRFTYLWKDVIQHRERKLKIVPSAVHINNVISWLILNKENCFFAVSNWESDMRNQKKFKSYAFKTDYLQFSRNAQKQIEWDSLTAFGWEKWNEDIVYEDSNLLICIKWTEASIWYRLFSR